MGTGGGRSARQEASVNAKHGEFNGRVPVVEKLLEFSISYV